MASVNDSSTDNFTVNMWMYAAPVMVPVGVAENILSVLTLRRSGLQMIPSRRTLIVLSIVDALSLIFGMGRYWVKDVWNIYPQNINSFLCKSVSYLIFVVSESSSLLIACVSVERMLAVVWPHVHHGFKNFDSIACIVVLMFVHIVNIHILATTVLIPTDNKTMEYRCVSQNMYVAVAVDVVDTLLLSYLPFLIIVVCNSTIILRLRSLRLRFSALVLNSTNNTQTPCLEDKENGRKGGKSANKESTRYRNRHQSNRQRRSSMPDHRKRDARVTNTLLLVTTCFLICNLPFAVVHLVRTSGQLESSNGWNTAWIASYILVYLNNCLNFPVYVVSQANFRRELRHLLSEPRCIAFLCARCKTSQQRNNKLTEVTTIATACPSKRHHYKQPHRRWLEEEEERAAAEWRLQQEQRKMDEQVECDGELQVVTQNNQAENESDREVLELNNEKE